jgi:GNAT superfamily N-acetyltransferase
VQFRIAEVGEQGLEEYSTVPIAFEVRSALRVERVGRGLGGFTMTEEPVAEPYVKDYDGPAEGGPARWARKFDLTNWGIFIGYDNESPVCAATVAYDTPGVHMLGGRRDIAVLWDIRVAPERRRTGIGARIFSHAAGWARGRGARQLKIETQNVNVPACRFYLSRGCMLGGIDAFAYGADPCVAHEVMLVWYLDL